MSIAIKYHPFFSVAMNRSEPGGLLNSFTFFPLRECRHKLQNYNMVFRSRPSGFDVYYCSTPIIPIDTLERFQFGFRILQPAFLNRYGLAAEEPADPENYEPNLCFDNLADDGSIITASPASLVQEGIGSDDVAAAADTCRFYPQTFTVRDEPGGAAPTEYTLAHRYDTSLTQTVAASPGTSTDYRYTTINSIDLEEDFLPESGPYMLSADTTPPEDQRIYLDDELSQSGAHGIVDIYWESSQDGVSDPATGQIYNITFKPK